MGNSTNGPKIRAPRNRTLVLTEQDRVRLRSNLLTTKSPITADLFNAVLLGDTFEWAPFLPVGSVDLLILDPPYNLTKEFHGLKTTRTSIAAYSAYLERVISSLLPTLTPHATIYVCSDWLTSVSVFEVASKYFTVRNRITWEREKGRGAQSNWKNASEDIWFCTNGPEYTFNVDDVKLRRKVIAPYTDGTGAPKDWEQTASGRFRDTYPSNIWTDITIPFWSMPENTDHPTQKSEKLIAKLLLASSNPGDLVLDPFLGSGTTAVVAKKLGRHFLGVEVNEDYCLWASQRLELAESDGSVQGFRQGVFWQRNSALAQKGEGPQDSDLFD